MSYNTKIIREAGGSVLGMKSGASQTFHDGTKLQIQGVRFHFGANVPGALVGTAGDLYLRGGSGAGSMGGIYYNVSDGANGGSVWRRAGSAIGAGG